MEMGNGKRIDAQLCEIVCSACHEHFLQPEEKYYWKLIPRTFFTTQRKVLFYYFWLHLTSNGNGNVN